MNLASLKDDSTQVTLSIVDAGVYRVKGVALDCSNADEVVLCDENFATLAQAIKRMSLFMLAEVQALEGDPYVKLERTFMPAF